MIRSIVLSWVGTLPVAAGLAALFSWIFALARLAIGAPYSPLQRACPKEY
ncbi:MAG TPA: hypothetical protein VGQ81_12685 [Acidobacteriota bacterium]|nr:hypothetical protein [Acidobacteriota bacterium]